MYQELTLNQISFNNIWMINDFIGLIKVQKSLKKVLFSLIQEVLSKIVVWEDHIAPGYIRMVLKIRRIIPVILFIHFLGHYYVFEYHILKIFLINPLLVLKPWRPMFYFNLTLKDLESLDLFVLNDLIYMHTTKTEEMRLVEGLLSF